MVIRRFLQAPEVLDRLPSNFDLSSTLGHLVLHSGTGPGTEKALGPSDLSAASVQELEVHLEELEDARAKLPASGKTYAKVQHLVSLTTRNCI